MTFDDLKEGDRFQFVGAAMFNSGVYVVTVPIRPGILTGASIQGHHELSVRWDREVEKVEDA